MNDFEAQAIVLSGDGFAQNPESLHKDIER